MLESIFYLEKKTVSKVLCTRLFFIECNSWSSNVNKNLENWTLATFWFLRMSHTQTKSFAHQIISKFVIICSMDLSSNYITDNLKREKKKKKTAKKKKFEKNEEM